MMKRKFKCITWILITTLAISSLFTSCDDDEEDEEYIGNWIELSDFEGVPRCDAVAFSIGDKGYVGTGYDGEDRLSDFWEYNVEKNTWLQIDSFPGVARNGAVAFAANGKGYVGLGYDGINKLKDFWEYNPETSKWRQVADFSGSARYGAIALGLNNKGYIGAGYDGNYLKDFWEYNPANNIWTQKVSIGGSKRKDAIAFEINGKGYVCTGINNGQYQDDMWEYDPLLDTWIEKSSISDVTDDDFDDDYSSIIGINKSAFSINGKGYVVAGGENYVSSNVWEYDPTTDLWAEKTDLEGAERTEATAFVVNNRAFLTTGRSSSYYFDDIWEFLPDDDYDEND